VKRKRGRRRGSRLLPNKGEKTKRNLCQRRNEGSVGFNGLRTRWKADQNFSRLRERSKEEEKSKPVEETPGELSKFDNIKVLLLLRKKGRKLDYDGRGFISGIGGTARLGAT